MQTAEMMKDVVKKTYGTIAQTVKTNCCGCGTSASPCCGDTASFNEDYAQVAGHYAAADLNLGCGIPTQFANLSAGQVVLDLGAGAGNDVFVARSFVGETGKVIGVDMTEAMVARAKQNQAQLGYHNVEFRFGEIEALPVADAEVDVVISNCVLNLVPDKRKAFQEIFRVLQPGGYFCISDIVLQGALPESLKSVMELYAGCVAGALQQQEYLDIIQETGFIEVAVKKTREIELSDEMLTSMLSAAARDDVRRFRQVGHAVISLTVFAKKP